MQRPEYRIVIDRQSHWQNVYATKSDAELSWFQPAPALSLSLFRQLDPRPRSALDVGGGQSPLAGELLALGVQSVTVLDVSQSAIERSKQRLGELARRVHWLESNVLASPSLDKVDLWHDRACFHFLTDGAQVRSYVQLASRTVTPGGHLIIATFGPQGPERCSGLPVQRHDTASLALSFAPAFELVRSAHETHQTPWGKPQEFVYAVLRREQRSQGSRGPSDSQA